MRAESPQPMPKPQSAPKPAAAPWGPLAEPRWPLAATVAGCVALYMILNWRAVWVPVRGLIRVLQE